jgi:phosphoserine phosphatase
MVVFDMDGTLIEAKSSWWLIHEAMGTSDQAKEYERMYREGIIDYDKWAELDVSTWIGKDFSPAYSALKGVRLMKGAQEAVRLLRSKGFLVGVVSAGLNVVLEKVLEEVKLDFYEVNELELEDNIVIGWKTRVGYRDKGIMVIELSKRFSISLDHVTVVGDAENDLEMFKLPQVYKIAFLPSHPRLEKLADIVIREKDLMKVAEAILKKFNEN